MSTKILTAYKYTSDNNLLSTIHRVLGKMEGNANFPQPPAALESLKQELGGFIAALTNASGGDLEKVAIKNTKRAAMIEHLTRIIEYVTVVGKGDRATLLSSGFPLTREKGDTSLVEIKDIQVSIGKPGEANTRIKRVAGARAYVHQCAIDPVGTSSVWITKTVAEPRYTFTNLQSKERYVFKVVAVGVKGQEVSSPEVSRVIQ